MNLCVIALQLTIGIHSKKSINMYPNLGYCCINLELQATKKITTNRTMVRKTFDAKGIKYASELALQNVKDLVEIVKWNESKGIKLYRMSSDMFPWMSDYELSDLPDFEKICNVLKGIGALALKYGQRLTFHPGPYNVLASPNESVVTKAIKDLRQHGEIMDLLGFQRNQYSAINIHIGGTYGDKKTTMERFCANFKRLPECAASRLVVENDDKNSMYSVEDLYNGIYMHIGTPITFDYLHHACNPGDLSEEEAIKLASKTWGIVPQLTHYSSSKKLYEDSSVVIRAHADYLYEEIKCYNLLIDIEIEAKAKEKALLKYLKDFDKQIMFS
jgi:UV DNA damage endonuclease